MADIVSNELHVQKVKEEHKKSLDACIQKIKQWEKFKVDYEVLQDHLKTLADKISYNIMVPFGPHAFMPGKLVHTNEVTVLLGDNWFAKVSTKHACEIIGRRIKQCDNMLSDLNKEKLQFENWLCFISNISNQDLVEIREEFNPIKEAIWREQHSKNLREYKLKERQTRISNTSQIVESNGVDSSESDEYYLHRLEQLEAEELIEKDDLEEEEDECDLTTSEETDDTEDQSSASPETELKENGHVDHNDNMSMNSHDNENEETSQPTVNKIRNNVDKEQERHVRWIDLSEDKSRRITFTHSVVKTTPPKKKHRRRRRSSSTSEIEEEENEGKDNPVINSPSDIYKCFSFTNQHSKPKSILKTINSLTSVPVSSSLESTSSEDINLSEVNIPEVSHENEVTEKVFTGQIFERSINENFSNSYNKNTRPKSVFKQTRNHTRR